MRLRGDLRTLDARCSTGRMPEAKDIDGGRVAVDLVNDPIGPVDEFPDRRIMNLRHHPSPLRQRAYRECLVN